MPLWNIETLDVHHSFISKSFTKSRLATVKQKDLGMKAMIFEQRSCIHFRVCRFGKVSYLGSRALVTRNKDCV
jgi:hypothetical protein